MRDVTHAILTAATLSVGLIAVPGSAQANLLTNGSFESPVLTIDYKPYYTGSTAITGWTVVGLGSTGDGRVEVVTNDYAYFVASDGEQAVDTTGVYGYDKGLISDAVSTVVGESYILSFDLGSVRYWGSTTVSVQINDETPIWFVNEKSTDIGIWDTDWENMSLTWVANDSTAQITFLGVANGTLSNNGVILLDNVVFEAVGEPIPEPATLALLGMGLFGLAATRRHRAA